MSLKMVQKAKKRKENGTAQRGESKEPVTNIGPPDGVNGTANSTVGVVTEKGTARVTWYETRLECRRERKSEKHPSQCKSKTLTLHNLQTLAFPENPKHVSLSDTIIKPLETSLSYLLLRRHG